MSMPNIPNITPIISLDRCETIDLLLSSIALEEIGLSHILNAEGEKLQAFLEKSDHCLNDYLRINDSVNKTLRTIVKSQMLLQFKLEDVVALDETSICSCVCTCEHQEGTGKKRGCCHHHCEECCCHSQGCRCKQCENNRPYSDY
ncbi:hypothetical protein [Oceanobacillus sp. CFH 90083]|uniref:hypothetical protein n=1 Tax=Oceanobacillus sp. CFH 90083 TaxID=2592336 RepID=UPI00128E6D67|nr:hypothetical protein [Oceanobacillus sp. CFH 90083]